MSVAVTSSLPSPLQLLTVVVKPVSMTLMLGLITLALFVAAGQAEVVAAEWKTPPAMDTFTTYEDMQRYFDHRNQRTLRQIENPSDDSYLAAFNFHNEQEIHRTRRSAVEHKELPQKPKFYKFEMADAVEPSEEVKELIRQYKSRTFQQNDKYLETVPSSDNKKPIVKRTPSNNERASKSNNNFQKQAKRSTRPKRSTNYRQPANFKVQYIPFDVSDAREPDSQTKMLIKRMRALEIEKLAQDLPNPYPGVTANLDVPISAISTTPKPSTKRPKYMKMKKAKRSKRGAPEMIKFELADARDSDTPSKPVVHTKKHTREAKDLQVDKKSEIDEESTQPKANDQSAQASKRYFVYKEAPAKVKKSVSALPHDVQNILSHLIKGNNAGKANVKYLSGKQVDYRAYQAPKFAQAYYGHGGGGGGGLGGYGKYAGGQVQAEKVQYVYQPVIVGGGGGGRHEGGGGAGIKYIGGGGHEGGGGGGEVKYVVAGGGGGGHEGGGGAGIKYIAAGGGGGHEGGGGGEVKYVAAGGGGSHEVGGDGGYGLKYVAAIGHGGGYAAGGEGGHGGGYAAGGEEGHGGGYGGGGAVAGHVIQYVAAGGGEHGGGYAAAEGGGGGHGGGYAAVGGHGGGYALIHGAGAGAHVNYGGYGGHAGGYEAAHGQAAAAIAHPIIVPEAGGGQNKEAAYDGGYGEDENGKNEGNQVIKNIPAPQFKAAQEDVYETKYSVVPTVEQYSNTPTQEFKLKLYSPESLLAKAQLEAKDRAKAAEEQILKAKAAAYAHGAGGGGEGYGGGGGHGGGYAAGGHGGGYGGGGHGGGYGGGGHGGGYAAGGHGGGYGGGGHGGGYGGGAGEGGKGEGGAGPLIKIEYHAPAESLNENYKDIAEFKQLSSLRQPNYGGGGHGGHGGGGGGGYAAEGGAASGEERPQDNKAPIQFHPDNGGQQLGGGGHYQALSAAPGKYIGLSKSQQYIPVIEQAGAVELKAGGGGGGGGGGEEVKAAAGLGGEGGAGGKIAAPHSYMAYGLSPNYKGVGGLKGGGAIGHGQPGLGVSSYNGIHDAGYDEAAAKLQSYASKYAFGYRVRDFNTGNDFGHKQNRDVHGVTRGQYHILLPDGRIQNVIYHADDTGFHADVSFAGGQ